MSNLCIKKIAISLILSAILCGCSPLVPGNYLGPTTIQSSQKINGQLIRPRLIPLNAEMLNSSVGRALLEPAMKPQPYRIGPFDNLNIIVWGHPDISTIATLPDPVTATMGAATSGGINPSNSTIGASNPAILVQTDGTIFYPYVGHLKVSGLTVGEAQNKITERLSQYIRNPQVTVQVAKFRNRNAYVLGEVKDPGMLPLTDKPLTLMEAISSAGGILPGSADPTHIYVIRGTYQHPDIFWLNAQTPQSLMIAQQFSIQENDIVYVSAATLTGVNHLIGQVLPPVTTYFTLKALVK